METHNAIVSGISARVKQFHKAQKPFRIYHGSTNSTRNSQRRADNTIDTSQLTHVLSVDTTSKTALVEPNVPMDVLVTAALRHGLMPPVVMEFPGITVGGGFSGTSGESSSFRYGAFDTTMRSIEMVLPDGEVAKASRTERPDLFWGLASAFGTLGVVTLLEVQLKEAKEYVRLEYSIAGSAKEAVAKMKEECGKETNDFVDAIAFSMDSTLICTGTLTDELPKDAKPRTFTHRRDPWFYIRAQKVQKQLQKKPSTPVTDYIPLTDYLFRYDRGGFWVARYAFNYFITPFNRITRTFLDPLLHAREMYRAVHKSGLADLYMIQDVGVPYDRVEEFQGWLHDTFDIYPLWLCPLRVRRDDPDSSYGLHAEFSNPDTPDLMNFGVWGPLKGSRREVVQRNRELEQKVQELGGKKWLYAHAYYTEEEFWAHYNRESYDALRIKYGATYLPSVYDKVKVDVDAEERAERATRGARWKGRVWRVWPLRGLYGFYCAVVGGEYLLKKSTDDGEGEKRDVKG